MQEEWQTHPRFAEISAGSEASTADSLTLCRGGVEKSLPCTTKGWNNMKKQNYWGYIFTLPFMINILVLVLFPVIFSTYISFTEWDLFNAPQWVGLQNWIDTLQKREFWVSMRNIFFFALVFVPVQTVFAF